MSVRARWRIATRLARRQVRRTISSSVLIMALIALPIAGMTAFSVVSWSMNATPAEQVRAELGQMQAWVQPAGVPNSGFWQAPTDPRWNGYPTQSNGEMIMPEGSPPTDPIAALPADTEAIRVVDGLVRTDTEGGNAALAAWAGEVWHPGFAGRFDLLDGRAPVAATEALVSPGALARIGISLGDEITLTDSGETYTVVGTMHAARVASDQTALFLPSDASVSGNTRWFLPHQELSWTQIEDLNEQGVIAYSRAVMLEPPIASSEDPWRSMHDTGTGMMWGLFGVLVAAGVFAAYVVVMLAGAAFSVAARRQQRSLAVAASVGATPSDLRRTVLMQGTVLGLIGGAAGLLLGVGLAALIMLLTDDGSGTRFWGFHMPWLVLIAILGFSTLVGTAAAGVPARAVSRADTLSALRGARRPQQPQASRPIWGSVVLLIGVAVTIASAVTTAGMQVVSLEDVAWDSPLRTIPPFGIVAGPILVQIGILLSGRWLLWLTSRALSRLSLAARLATRDAAANASRTVPAFAAIGATVFIAVFALSQGSMQTAHSAKTWYYQAPVGSMIVHFYPGGTGTVAPLTPEELQAAATSGRELAETAGADSVAIIGKQISPSSFASPEDVPAELTWTLALMPEHHLLDPLLNDSFTTGHDRQNPISVIAEDELSTAVGIALSSAQLADYRSGAALVADDRWVTGGTIDVASWNARDAYRGSIPNNIWTKHPDVPEYLTPDATRSLDAIVIDEPHQPHAITIAPETAQRLGIIAQPEQVIAAFTEPLSDQSLDRVQAHSELLSTADVVLAPYVERGPSDDQFWMIPVLLGVAVLVLGASSVALGLARFERRPDDATLTAIGGTPGLRRGIGFWQGLLIAGFGTLAGAAAGILPPIGFSVQSRGMLSVADIPWLALAALAVALPLLIAFVSWLIPPRHADLTRRTVIA